MKRRCKRKETRQERHTKYCKGSTWEMEGSKTRLTDERKGRKRCAQVVMEYFQGPSAVHQCVSLQTEALGV